MSRLPWRKSKTLAMLANKRQWEREFDPVESSELEIETEDGVYIITETSTTAVPTYYRTE
jgi:hypothetical protein